MKIIVRRAQKSDYPLIFSTWKRQLLSSSHEHYDRMRRRVYNEHIGKLLENIVAMNKLYCASPDDYEDQILGWTCFSPIKNALIFSYVKAIYRDQGIMSKMMSGLLHGSPDFYCFKTNDKTFKKYIKKEKIEYLPVEFIL